MLDGALKIGALGLYISDELNPEQGLSHGSSHVSHSSCQRILLLPVITRVRAESSQGGEK